MTGERSGTRRRPSPRDEDARGRGEGPSPATTPLDPVIETLDRGEMIVDASGVVRVCDAGAMELLGLPPEMMLARPSFEAVRRHQLARGDGSASADILHLWFTDPGLDRTVHRCRWMRPNGLVLDVCTV